MKIARVTEDELSSGVWFERGYQHNKAKEYDYAIYCYTEAIRLKPDYASAYNDRGLAHYEKGDLDAAIKDYNETIASSQIMLVPSTTEAILICERMILKPEFEILKKPFS